jgi:hypothetical protein
MTDVRERLAMALDNYEEERKEYEEKRKEIRPAVIARNRHD